MVRTKVFVGNLSFNTRENELAKEFEIAGKVISANIITRGPRSLGYGFVEMDNESDAENAVKMLDKKEIDGRPINVEVAKPREEGASDAQAANAQGVARGTRGGRGGRGRGGSDRADRPPRNVDNAAPRSRPQGQQSQNNQGQNQGNQGQNQGGQGQQAGNNSQQFRRRRSDEEGEGSRGGRQGGARPPRAPRVRPEGEADNRTPSTTTLFVANLPFSVDDDGFSKVLKDSSLAYKTAHVVKKRTGRSKGFGFIEFDNEGDQQKALAALNNKDMEGRPLAVKVALTELRTPNDASPSTSAPKSGSPAPNKNASSSPAPNKSAQASSPAPAKSADKPTTPKQEKK